MRSITAPLGVAIAIFVAGCDGASGLIAPDAEALFAGPTVSVEVVCPTPLEVGYGGQCVAYGRDANGFATGSAASGWWSTAPGTVSVDSTGYVTAGASGSATIHATVDGIGGSTPVLVTTPLSVFLVGSDTAEPGDYSCNFWALPSGGTGGYEYYFWTTGGSAWGIQSGASWTGGSTSDYTLHVLVTDSSSAQAQDSIQVQVYAGAPPCPH